MEEITRNGVTLYGLLRDRPSSAADSPEDATCETQSWDVVSLVNMMHIPVEKIPSEGSAPHSLHFPFTSAITSSRNK
jgi:hypothetical protein